MWSQFGIALVALVALDALWLGLVMKAFYKQQLAPLARMADGNLAPIWPAAAMVYLFLAAGVTLLVLGRARSPLDALALGALLGLVIYGVYDFTNYATLREWPLPLVIVDVMWGTVLCAATAWVATALTKAY